MDDEEAIFTEALTKGTPAERRAFLEHACSGKPRLRRAVEALLAAHEGPSGVQGGLLDVPPPGLTEFGMDRPATAAPPGEAPGATVGAGRYRLVERIGEGGYGVVFLAEQSSPVRRRVAVKIVKPGMDTRHVIARFEAERQALAVMDHPNIAKVFDAGVTETGRPYFAMELVRGVPITRYCDEQRLDPRRRLGLFVRVCEAVQHAHQKGIIHRDIKPTNILVTQGDDGEPAPKVIDFGIAKATGPRLTEQTLYTGVGNVIGTPEYMSPEQADLNSVDVDTRSDIYSLGVVLYELLTGSTPIEHARVREAALLEVLRVIREEDPPRPSTRLGTTEQLASIAANRGVEPRTLSGLVRGELDWIVMKALEKDRGRRYETVNGLARDVERHLADEPVQACPPSRAYRFRKFARRHRTALAAAGAMTGLLLAGITGTTIGLMQAREAKARAEMAAGRAQALSAFLSEAFTAANPGVAGGDREIKVVDLLDRAAARLGEALAGQPEAEVDARMTIGRTYKSLGLYAAAVDNFRRAHELARGTHGPEAELTMTAADELAWCMIENGDYLQAEPLALQMLETAKRVYGTGSKITWEAAATYGYCFSNGWRASQPDWQAKLAESLPVKRQVVEWIRQAPKSPAQQRRLAEALHAVALVLVDQTGSDGHAEAERLWREAITLLRQDPAGDPYPRIHTHYAHVLTLVGKLDEAKQEFQAALADQRRQFGDTHGTTLVTRVFYAHLLRARREYAAAANAYEELISLQRAGTRVRMFVPHNTMLSRLLYGLARARLGTGEPEAALRAADEMLALTRAAGDPSTEPAYAAWRLRGIALYRLGDWRGAADSVTQAMQLLNGGNGYDWFMMAMAQARLGDPDAARGWYDRAVAWTEKHRPDDPDLRERRQEAERLIGTSTPPAIAPHGVPGDEHNGGA